MPKDKLFPVDARLNRVNGMLRVLFHNNCKLTVAQLSKMTDNEVDTLLPQVNSAELLKLVRVSEDDIILTALGKSLYHNEEEADKEISKSLLKFEPFKTAHEMSKKEGRFRTEQLAEKLKKRKLVYDLDKERNENMIKNILFQWGIPFSIIDYYGMNDYWTEDTKSMWSV